MEKFIIISPQVEIMEYKKNYIGLTSLFFSNRGIHLCADYGNSMKLDSHYNLHHIFGFSYPCWRYPQFKQQSKYLITNADLNIAYFFNSSKSLVYLLL